MTTIEPAVVALRSPRTRPRSDLRSKAADYLALTKPEVNFLILITTFAGFRLALPGTTGTLPVLRLVSTLVGTLLVAAGTGTLNQYIERRFDAQMRRTARRPLAAGRLQSSAALGFGILLSATGVICLALAVNVLASLLAALTLVSYLFVYTPLKRKTPLCILVGALPGAMPPLIGWVGASGKLSIEAWVLYGIVFLWQFPHFMAIAWMYREDYARAGYLVLPFGDARQRFMAWQTLAPALVLVPLALAPALLGHAGVTYVAGALLLSGGFLYYAARLVLRPSNAIARQLLFASIIYLPALFAALVVS
jgi:protoheme IX farnesyltransferase